jgi:hypothetical protein
MEPISIRYRLSEPEFMTACDAHWSAQRTSTLSNVITAAVMFVVGLVTLFFMFWLATVLFAVGGLLLLITWLRSLLWRKLFREAKKYNDDISVTIDDDTVRVESAVGKSDLDWNFFTWYLDTPEHVLLYMTKRNFSVIPKKAFRDTQQVDSFLEVVRKRLKSIK